VHLFGLTGGIASGKSTVAARLRARGVPVIDADEVAREVVAAGTPGLEAVVAAFGPAVLDRGGALDRKALGQVVFADEGARRRLNAILHPRIGQRTAERSMELEGRGEPLACYEAALLVENGLMAMFRPLVVVACEERMQLARLRARDGLTEDEARARVAAQKPLAEKVAVADHVIDTSGSLADVAARTDEVLVAVCRAAGVDPSRYGAGSSP
jgi:dephospho-CoA kinase